MLTVAFPELFLNMRIQIPFDFSWFLASHLSHSLADLNSLTSDRSTSGLIAPP